MFHYLFTNDLRISSLDHALTEAARCFKNDCVPSASEDKNANNNMMTLGFYFNLTKDTTCSKEGATGNVRKVVLNFIKKFQFPNPRTSASLNDCIADGIMLAPMRTILKILYIMSMTDGDEAFLTKKEILNYIFFNPEIAKNPSADIIALTKDIIASRDEMSDDGIPSDEVLEQKGYYWKHCSRQIREMIKVLCWSGCVMETEKGAIRINEDHLTRDNKADIYEIITCSDYWMPLEDGKFDDNRRSYQTYMDINDDESTSKNDTEESEDFSSDVLNHNLYGIHMKEKNTALSEGNPHICIGWSNLGDLSTILTKEELADLYSREWPEAKSKTRGQNVGQVWRFVDEMQIGDYVVFADGNVFHIGRIESEYYYDESVDENQSSDYKNTRKVEWLKKGIQRSEVSAALHRSLMTAMSVWTMNDYRAAIADLLNGTYVSDEEYVEESEDSLQIKYKTGYKSDFAMNRIIFGAPGTGKSYTINKEAKLLIGEDNETDYERVTFHPDYSYANFVGTYKPVMVGKGRQFSADPDTDYVVSVLNDKGKSAQEKYDVLFERFRGDGLTRLPVLLGLYTDEIFKTRKQDGTDAAGDNSVERNHGRAIRKYVKLIDGQEKAGDIAYEYVPGPFMRVYINALKNARTDNPKPYLLIIEEINRANVAAVFGDVFQLLDRNDDNVSEYPIQASEDIKKYLAKELGGTPDDYTKIRIPDNMFIWATMNSADQGVFPMDTAFKRRWDFTYLGIDDSDTDIRGKYVEVGSKYKQRIEWNSLRRAINDFLAAEKINEDKQLGPYFISRDIVVPADDGDTIDSKRFCDVFKHKVLMYLFDDAAKQKRMKLFGGFHGDALRYSEICKEFDEQGIGIFNSSIQSQVDVKDLVTNDHELDENGLPKIDE